MHRGVLRRRHDIHALSTRVSCVLCGNEGVDLQEGSEAHDRCNINGFILCNKELIFIGILQHCQEVPLNLLQLAPLVLPLLLAHAEHARNLPEWDQEHSTEDQHNDARCCDQRIRGMPASTAICIGQQERASVRQRQHQAVHRHVRIVVDLRPAGPEETLKHVKITSTH